MNLIQQMHQAEEQLSELDPELDYWLFSFTEQRLSYIYKRIIREHGRKGQQSQRTHF